MPMVTERLKTTTESFQIRYCMQIYLTQLSPETFDPRKMDANFLEANFEYFRLSTARDDKNN